MLKLWVNVYKISTLLYTQGGGTAVSHLLLSPTQFQFSTNFKIYSNYQSAQIESASSNGPWGHGETFNFTGEKKKKGKQRVKYKTG